MTYGCPQSIFEHLRDLRNVSVGNNDLSHLSSETFASLIDRISRIRNVNLFNVGLSQVDPRALEAVFDQPMENASIHL